MTRLSRLLLLLCALAVLPVALAACGGEEDADPQTVLRETFGPDKPIKSGDLDLALDLNLQGIEGLSGPIRARLDGPFQSQGGDKLPNFDFELDIDAGGQTFSAGAVSTGEKGFVELQGQAFDIGDQLYEQFRSGYEQAQKEGGDDKESDGPTFESLGIEPLRWLRNPQAAGEEQLDGTDTTHIRATVDVKRFLEDVSRLLDRAEGLQIEGAGEVPGGLTAEQRTQVARAVKTARVDVWSGKDDRTLRRLRLAVDLDVPQDVRKDVGGLTGGRIAFTFGITDLNEDQEVEAPENARPFEELQAALGGLLGGVAPSTGSGSGGATAGGGTGTTTAPQSGGGAAGGGAKAPKAYLDCLGDAGSDVGKIQGCARFLD